MIMDPFNRRPEIKYPTDWIYKVIGKNLEAMIDALEETGNNMEYEITPSNVSKNAKYYSLNFKVNVTSEIIRDIIYNNLEKEPEIIMIL